MFIFSWKNYLCFSSKFKCLPISLPPPSPSPTTSTLINNFNSLYHHQPSTSTSDNFFSSSEDSSDTDAPPDFATVFASQRFFFSSPGHSNSIISETPTCPPEPNDTLVAGSVAVQTLSPDPFVDFRKSMQEMVEARGLANGMADWDFLHELLICYLTLNPRHTHKFIIKAFSDLVISVMSSESYRKIEDRQLPTASPPRLV